MTLYRAIHAMHSCNAFMQCIHAMCFGVSYVTIEVLSVLQSVSQSVLQSVLQCVLTVVYVTHEELSVLQRVLQVF